MADLNQAIMDLAAELAKVSFSEDLLAEIAEDNGVNPKLLERKFQEKFKVTPEDFQPLQKTKLSETYLRQQAEKMWRDHLLIGKPTDNPIFGKYFTFENNEYMAVAYIAGNELLCIKVANGKPWSIVWKSQAGIQKFLRNKL